MNTARLHLFARNCTNENCRVRKQKASSGFEHPCDLAKGGHAMFEMQNYVEGHHCIERSGGQGEVGIEVVLPELEQSAETCAREAVASGIQCRLTHVDANAATAHPSNDKLQ